MKLTFTDVLALAIIGIAAAASWVISQQWTATDAVEKLCVIALICVLICEALEMIGASRNELLTRLSGMGFKVSVLVLAVTFVFGVIMPYIIELIA